MASELEGVAELSRQLNSMGAQVAGKELRGTARAAMKHVYDLARLAIPVGSVPHKTYKGRRVFGGFARRNIRLIAYIDKKTGNVGAIVGPSAEAFYATSFVELGTSKMAARPWLRPAFSFAKGKVLTEIGTQLRKRLQKIARRSR